MPIVAPLLTYSDAIDLLVDFMEGQGKPASQPAIRRAIQAAYEDIATAHRWSFLERHSRVLVDARETGTTAVFDFTGGTHERQLTVSGDDTFPTWAEDAAIRFGDDDLVCDIESRKSSTVVTLDATMNPGQDVSTANFVLYRRWIPLPADFISFTGPFAETGWRMGEKISLTAMLGLDRYNSNSGDILYYAIGEVPDLYNRKALYIYPQMETTRTLDFLYLRRPREMRFTGHDANDFVGTIAVTAGSETVTGTSTAFSSDHIGSILRIGTGTDRPTGRFGLIPYAEERSIVAVASTTSLTLDSTVATTRSAKKYQITDPMDVGRVAHNAFLRLAEKYLVVARKLENWNRVNEMADRSLIDAMAGDNTTVFDPVANLPYPMAGPPDPYRSGVSFE